MRKPNFLKLGILLIMGAIAFITDNRNMVPSEMSNHVIEELRSLHNEYNRSYGIEEKGNIAKKVVSLMENNAHIKLPNDLQNFVMFTMTSPIE